MNYLFPRLILKPELKKGPRVASHDLVPWAKMATVPVSGEREHEQRLMSKKMTLGEAEVHTVLNAASPPDIFAAPRKCGETGLLQGMPEQNAPGILKGKAKELAAP